MNGGPIRSRRLWSLWDLMQKFEASKFVEISNWLAQLHQRLVPGQWVGFPAAEYEVLQRDIAAIERQLRDMELDAAEVSAGKLLSVLDRAQPQQRGDLKAMMFSATDAELIRAYAGDVVTRARDQLQSRLLLEVPMRARDLYTQPIPLFGEGVTLKFPTAAYDVEEAGKCLALDRSTASAFHSIRCLEAGIRAMARCLGIPDPTKGSDRGWFKLLGAIQKELDRRWPPSARLSGDGRFFEEAHAALAAMQNPWRNATMHLDQKYTDEEARHVFEVVKGFMTKLASRCDENGDPKV